MINPRLEPMFHASAPSPAFEHIGEPQRFPGPRAEISRDRNLVWWRRIMPVLKSHRLTFIGAITFSFVSLIFQTLVPKIVMSAIDRLTPGHHQPIHGIVVAVLIIGLFAGVAGYLSRRFLFTTAYNVESDLRNLMYEHLAWLSFGFYDRVQSGQLISRANSDSNARSDVQQSIGPGDGITQNRKHTSRHRLEAVDVIEFRHNHGELIPAETSDAILTTSRTFKP